MSSQCEAVYRETMVCLQVTGAAGCNCFELDTFQQDFDQTVRAQILGTQAFVPSTDPDFCVTANERLCTYRSTMNCCCQPEIDRLQDCWVKEVVIPELGFSPAEPCSGSCTNALGVGNDSGDGGSSLIMIVAIAVGVLLFGGGAYYFFFRRGNTATPRNKKSPRNSNGPKKQNSKRSNNIEGSSTEKRDVESVDASFDDIESGEVQNVAKNADYEPRAGEDDKYNEPKKKDRRVVSDESETSFAILGGDRSALEESTDSSSAIQEKKKRPTKEDRHSKRASKAQELKKKKHAIETWHKEKKRGSDRSLQSYLSEEMDVETFDPDTEDIEEAKRKSARNLDERESKRASKSRSYRQSSSTPKDPIINMTIHSDQQYDHDDTTLRTTRTVEQVNKEKIDMKKMLAELEKTKAELHQQMEEHKAELEARSKLQESATMQFNESFQVRSEETSLRLSQLEEAQVYYTRRLQDAEEEAEALRLEKFHSSKRIAELEARNKELESKLLRSESSDELKERKKKKRSKDKDINRSSSSSKLDLEESHGSKYYDDDEKERRERKKEKKRERKSRRSNSQRNLDDSDDSSDNRKTSSQDKERHSSKKGESHSSMEASLSFEEFLKSSKKDKKKYSRSGSSSKLDKKSKSKDDETTTWNHNSLRSKSRDEES